MSLNKKHKLVEIAKYKCRILRKQQTNAESIFWEKVRNRKINGLKFYRQYPVFYDLLGTETFYILDFYCCEKRTAVEIDGSIHSFKKKDDFLREEIINNLGIKVIRFKNVEIENNIEYVIDKLMKLLEGI